VNSWRFILATMVIFGTGVVTGGLLVHHVDRVRPARPQRGGALARPAPAPASPSGLRWDLLRRMKDALNLTPEQKDRTDAFISQAQDRTRKIMEPVRSQLQEEVKKAQQAIRDVLTPEQQARFDALLKKQQQQRTHEPRRSQSPREQRPAEGPPGATNS